MCILLILRLLIFSGGEKFRSFCLEQNLVNVKIFSIISVLKKWPHSNLTVLSGNNFAFPKKLAKKRMQ